MLFCWVIFRSTPLNLIRIQCLALGQFMSVNSFHIGVYTPEEKTVNITCVLMFFILEISDVYS